MEIFLSGFFIVAILLFVVLNFIDGLKKGLRKEIIKSITILIAAIIAFVMRNTTLAFIYEKFNVQEFISDFFNGQGDDIINLVLPIVDMVCLLIVFVLLYAIASILMLIVYLIIRNIGKNSFKVLESKFLGGILGIFAGILVSFLVVAPLNEVMYTAGSLIQTIDEIKPLIASASGVEIDVSSYEYLSLYANGTVCTSIRSYSKPITSSICKVTNSNNEQLTLDGQIGALRGLASIAGAISILSDVNFDDLSSVNPEDIESVFSSIETIKGSLSEEEVKTINDALVLAVTEILPAELGLDLSNIDISEINFASEGEAISSLISEVNNENPNYEEVAKNLVKSDLALEVLAANATKIEISDEDKEEIKNTIDNLDVSNMSEDEIKKINDNKESLYQIFEIEKEGE